MFQVSAFSSATVNCVLSAALWIVCSSISSVSSQFSCTELCSVSSSVSCVQQCFKCQQSVQLRWNVFCQQHCELCAVVFQVSAVSSAALNCVLSAALWAVCSSISSVSIQFSFSFLCSRQHFWGPKLSGLRGVIWWTAADVAKSLSVFGIPVTDAQRHSGKSQTLPADIPAVRICAAFLNATFRLLWCCCITSCVLKTDKAVWWVRWWFSFTKMHSVVYTLPNRHVLLPEQLVFVSSGIFTAFEPLQCRQCHWYRWISQ